MDRIRTFDEYKQKLTQFRAHYESRIYTNSYLLRHDIEKYIEIKSLFCIETSDNIFILLQEPTHYLLFYFFPSYEPILLPPLPLPVFVPIITSDDSLPAFDAVATESRFLRYRTFARMRAKCQELSFGHITSHPVRFAQEVEAEQILEIWRENSELYFSGIPTLDELGAWIKQQRVLVIPVDGVVRAVKVLEVVGQSLHTRLIAVDKDHRGLGMSKAMFAYAASMCKSLELETYELQVDVDYAPAVTGYLKYGFTYTGRKIIYYILES